MFKDIIGFIAATVLIGSILTILTIIGAFLFIEVGLGVFVVYICFWLSLVSFLTLVSLEKLEKLEKL